MDGYCGAELHDELAGLIERLRKLQPPLQVVLWQSPYDLPPIPPTEAERAEWRRRIGDAWYEPAGKDGEAR